MWQPHFVGENWEAELRSQAGSTVVSSNTIKHKKIGRTVHMGMPRSKPHNKK